ncbi:Protein kinase [Entamoeba marina]
MLVLFIVSTFASNYWTVHDDNVIEWLDGDGSWSGQGVSHNWDSGTSTDQFCFYSDCQTYYTFEPNSNEAKKYFYAYSTAQPPLSKFMVNKYGSNYYYFDTYNFPDNIFFEISGVAASSEFRIFDVDFILSFQMKDNIKLLWKSSGNHPYIYIAGNSFYPIVSNADPIDTGCYYAFSGSQIDVSDGDTTKVCERDLFMRYVICLDASLSSSNDCTCYIDSTKTTVKISDDSFNYPDCLHNNSFLDLTILSTQNDIRFNDGNSYTWYSIQFEDRSESVVIQTDSTLTVSQSTSFPSVPLNISGNVNFNNYVTIPSNSFSEGTHYFQDVCFNNGVGVSGCVDEQVVFLGSYSCSSSLPSNLILACSNGIYSRYTKSTSTISCDCNYDGSSYDVLDCKSSSLHEGNALNLVVEENQNYSEETAYWNSFQMGSGNFIGTTTSSSCVLNGDVTVNGNLYCDTLTLNPNTNVVINNGYLIQTTSVKSSGNVTVSGSFYYDNLNIDGALTLSSAISNTLSQLNMTTTSSLNVDNSLTITSFNGNGDVYIECTETLTFSELDNSYTLSIHTNQLVIKSGNPSIGTLFVETNPVIESSVSSISIDSITNLESNMDSDPFLDIESSTNTLTINSLPTIDSLGVETFYFLSLKLRQIQFESSLSPISICERQWVVIGSFDETLCPTIGLDTKICSVVNGLYYDSTNTYIDYSCPCESSDYVTTTLIVGENYELGTDEIYDNIQITDEISLTSNNKELIIKSSDSITIIGTNNSILFKNTTDITSTPLTISSDEQNMIFSPTTFGFLYDSLPLTLSVDGLCRSVFF